MFRFITWKWLILLRDVNDGAGSGGGTPDPKKVELPADIKPTVSPVIPPAGDTTSTDVIPPPTPPKTYSFEDMHRVNEEAKTNRIRYQTAEDQVKTLTEQITKGQARIKDLVVGTVVQDALRDAGAIDADLLIRGGVVELSNVELSTDGTPDKEKLATLIEGIKAASGHLFGRTQPVRNGDASAKGNTPGKPDIGSMSNEDFKKLEARVMSGEKVEL